MNKLYIITFLLFLSVAASAGPKATAGKSTSAPTKDKIIVFYGAYTKWYGLDTVLKDYDLIISNAHSVDGVSIFPSVEERNQTRLIILSDVSGGEFTPEQIQQIHSFVNQGGSVLVLGGPFTFGLGKFSETEFSKFIPVSLTPFDLKGGKEGLSFSLTGKNTPFDKLDFSTHPKTYWIHQVKPVEGASVFIKAGKYPLLISKKYGEGTIWAFTGTPLGIPAENDLPFWKWKDFPKLIQIIASQSVPPCDSTKETASRNKTTEQYSLRVSPNDTVTEYIGWLQLRRTYVQNAGRPIVIETEKSTSIVFSSDSPKNVFQDKKRNVTAVRNVKRLENTIRVKTAGTYKVHYHAFFPVADEWNHIEQMDDGRQIYVKDCNKISGVGNQWVWVKGPEYHLDPGLHTYLFPSPTAWCGGALLDKIVLLPADYKKPLWEGCPTVTPSRLPDSGSVLSNIFAISPFKSWRLDYEDNPCGGKIRIDYSYDRSNNWTSLPGKEPVVVPQSVTLLTFKISFFLAMDGRSPQIRNMNLIGYLR